MTKIKKTIKNIISTITNNKKLFNIFYFKTNNRKYSIKQLLKCVLNILKYGLPYRYYNKENKYEPHWNTIYKFYLKLIKYDIIYLTFNETVKKYTKNNIYLTDTTLIPNKYGSELISYNPQLLKHKSTKISVISDIKGNPINVDIYKSSIYDSKILNEQLNKINKNIKNSNNNILLGDAGYDSEIIRNKLKILNFGKLITPKNKRNTKDKNKLKSFKLDEESKKLLKNRIKIEHFFSRLKQYRRIAYRYDKKSITFLNFVYLACIDNILK